MFLLLIAALIGVGPTAADEDPSSPADAESTEPQEFPKKLYSGRVVFLEDALEEQGVETFEETGRHVVLETDEGDLIPILADWRGRAFYQDEQLRDRKVELIGFLRPGLPYLNVIAVYTFDEDGERMYTDYWCDVCSIPMYMIQPCECCQGDVRLRFQKQDLPEYIDGEGEGSTSK
ncbi:MAG: hypothetical protein DWQ34_23595 [Planctomycetota bacterium]|nr:MAG: hypothetical protein DWQ29_24800 [Planctomycetota bacterium]REJ87924.1 MAG: hypothetical protein DWQ34_23595 [Planctomycetota bacterium]REK23244.1 MAG: hypothetical protein DWQ41_17630 [Planctomycetota bacterium]REK30835.1 MAG: hypothetical protein DWQ45_20555 [Planctomycetota bacterium]